LILTLLVIPAVYTFIGKERKPDTADDAEAPHISTHEPAEVAA
jgi:hypothetical protein